MLVRIVKLIFKKENITSFEQIFRKTKQEIRSFDGCNFLELYQDKTDARVFFTYSYWENEQSLEAYRASPFFREVWSQTKPLFSAKPEAWSVNRIETLN